MTQEQRLHLRLLQAQADHVGFCLFQVATREEEADAVAEILRLNAEMTAFLVSLGFKAVTQDEAPPPA